MPRLSADDVELFELVSKQFLETGELPNIPQIATDVQLRRIKLPPGERRIVIQCHAHPFTGYGRLALLTVKALRQVGIDVIVRAIDGITDPPNCEAEIVEEICPEAWELLISPPFHHPTPGKTTVYFTMWEAGRLAQECIYNVNLARFCVVPSQWNAVVFNASGVETPLYVVNPGVDTSVYRPTERAQDGSTFVFGAAGTDYRIPRKGLPVVADAFRTAFPTETDVQLWIKTTSKDRIVDVQSDERIRVFNDWLTDQELADWYRSLDVYVTGSPGEGYGMHNVEAMACGVPVIACFAHSHTEYLHESCAYPVAFSLTESRPAIFNNPYQGALWYQPETESMVAQMRRVYLDRDELRQRGRVAAGRAVKFDLRTYGSNLITTLQKCGMFDPNAQPRLGRKPLKHERQSENTLIAPICVLGPKEEGCGVGQYGRQIASAIGGAYLPYGIEANGAESLIVQFHPFYFQPKTGLADVIANACRDKSVVVDIHHPDRINEARMLGDSAIYHARIFEVPVLDYFGERARYLPLVMPVLPSGGRMMTAVSAEYKIAWHGLWLPHKGVHLLIEAVSHLRQQGLDVGLVAVGGLHDVDENSYERSLNYWYECNEAVRRMGLEGRVGMSCEMANYADIRATLLGCDMYCLPYMTPEAGQSSAVLVGFALGLPVCASNSPIFEDWSEHLAVMPELQPEAIAKAVASVLTDYAVSTHLRRQSQLAAALCSVKRCLPVYQGLLS